MKNWLKLQHVKLQKTKKLLSKQPKRQRPLLLPLQ
jgi:hypothetical protein